MQLLSEQQIIQVSLDQPLTENSKNLLKGKLRKDKMRDGRFTTERRNVDSGENEKSSGDFEDIMTIDNAGDVTGETEENKQVGENLCTYTESLEESEDEIDVPVRDTGNRGFYENEFSTTDITEEGTVI